MGYRYSIKQTTNLKANNDWLAKVIHEEFLPNHCVSVVSDPNGKPLLHKPEGYFISASDSGYFLAAAIHDKPIGIDIEHLRERIPELLLYITDSFERASLKTLGKDATLAAWTAKEAAQKSDTSIHCMSAYKLVVKEDNKSQFMIRREQLSWRGAWFLNDDYICALAFRD